METNVLYYGDNLKILRNHDYFPDECIDLIYLDPPFNSKKSYNILFKDQGGVESEAQIKAFADTWHWTQSAQDTYHEIVTASTPNVGRLIGSLHDAIGNNDVMAYLVMMTARLIELHRVLKPTGSLYLHCDPTASHYLKIVLDQIFGPANFRNEIVWHHRRWTAASNAFQQMHDIILVYSKSDKNVFNIIEATYSDSQLRKIEKGYDQNVVQIDGEMKPQLIVYDWSKVDKSIKSGRLKLDKFARVVEKEERKLSSPDVWIIPPINSQAKERIGYPTQKPLALLERIIQASSNEGDVVLDPFCGCGTAVVAAQKLNRKWIGIDITHLAINLMRNRLKDSFGIEAKVIGEPEDIEGAIALSQQDRYQFQYWACGKIHARPLGEKKKGADKGIDGVIQFIDDATSSPKRVVVQVKSGHVSVKDIRELETVAADNAIGVFITLEPPTRPMVEEAVSAGYYHSPIWNRDYPKIQIITVEELFSGKKVDMPLQHQTSITFNKAQKINKKEGEQLSMG
jgi:site-specific DNA-methyltransferase (adenine-specific)